MRIEQIKDKQQVAIIRQKIKENDGYCPCKLIKDDTTRCPCESFRNGPLGECQCGLYIKTEE